MNIKTPQEIVTEKIQILLSFQEDIRRWFHGQYDSSDASKLYSQIAKNIQNVRNIAQETCCLKLMPTVPQSKTGLIVRDCDPFNFVLETPYYGVSFIPAIIEIIDEAIVVLKSPRYFAKLLVNSEHEPQ